MMIGQLKTVCVAESLQSEHCDSFCLQDVRQGVQGEGDSLYCEGGRCCVSELHRVVALAFHQTCWSKAWWGWRAEAELEFWAICQNLRHQSEPSGIVGLAGSKCRDEVLRWGTV